MKVMKQRGSRNRVHFFHDMVLVLGLIGCDNFTFFGSGNQTVTVTAVSLNSTSMNLIVGGAAGSLAAAITPANVTDGSCQFDKTMKEGA